jgi:hypothetical protein
MVPVMSPVVLKRREERMYDKKLYPKGIWTDRDYRRHRIHDPKSTTLWHLWSVVIFLTRNIPYLIKDKRFWMAKRKEILNEIDTRAKAGTYIVDAILFDNKLETL